MNGPGQSDRFVVPANPPDKAAAAEAGEERERTKGNTAGETRPGRSAGPGVSSELDRARQVAQRDKEARFTALLHHVSLERLVMAYWDLRPKAAPGVDGVTWDAYGQDLVANLRDLHERVQQGRYRASPSRRVYLRAEDRAASTVRTYGTLAGEFVAFTGTRGGLASCDAATIGAFVATLTGYQFKTVEQKLCAVRSFLRFASADGLVGAACLVAVPAARSSRQARIPSVWDPGEVARIVEAIDRDNPCGKRDYAIILLIARLGLRGVDVRRLEFADFDWPGNRLFVRQAKTGHRVQLPLLKEVGWAVIDYIRHGRPAATARRCSCGTWHRSGRSPTRTICIRSWSGTPGWLTSR